MTVSDKTVAQILALPLEDRAFIARTILESVEPEVDEDAKELWDQEIDRRSQEIEGGIKCEPIEDVLKAIRDDLASHRAS